MRGPIPTRIHQPAGLIFPGPKPRRAALTPEGQTFVRAELSYASIFEFDSMGEQFALFDGEIARGSLELRYGLSPDFEISVEPTVLFAGPGFLDRIVDEFHAVTGFVGGGRERFPRDQYTMRLGRGSETAFELEGNEVLFADLPITLVARLRQEDAAGPALALRGTVELPTGDQSSGAGSGGIDGAVGLLLERSRGRWTYFGNVDGTVGDAPGSFERAQIDVRSLLVVGAGVEYRWTERLSLLGQAVLQMPFTRSLDLEEIDREILDLGFGVAYDIAPGTALTATFHEDAVAASGPDLTLFLGLTWRP